MYRAYLQSLQANLPPDLHPPPPPTTQPSPPPFFGPITLNEHNGRAILHRPSIHGTFHNNRKNFWNTHVEPGGRPIAHWDLLLSELCWLQRDFKQERLLKTYNAWVLARACREAVRRWKGDNAVGEKQVAGVSGREKAEPKETQKMKKRKVEGRLKTKGVRDIENVYKGFMTRGGRG